MLSNNSLYVNLGYEFMNLKFRFLMRRNLILVTKWTEISSFPRQRRLSGVGTTEKFLAFSAGNLNFRKNTKFFASDLGAGYFLLG